MGRRWLLWARAKPSSLIRAAQSRVADPECSRHQAESLCLHSPLPGLAGDEGLVLALPLPSQCSASGPICSRRGQRQEHSRVPGRSLSFHFGEGQKICRRPNLPAPCLASFVFLEHKHSMFSMPQLHLCIPAGTYS